MSAFICSEKHINTIVSFGAQHNVNVYHDGVTVELRRYPQKIAEALLAENAASVNYRYDEDDKPRPIKYSYASMSPIAVYKLCESLSYQSCEHEGWEKSFAFAVIDEIKKTAINNIPGYEEAKWSI